MDQFGALDEANEITRSSHVEKGFTQAMTNGPLARIQTSWRFK